MSIDDEIERGEATVLTTIEHYLVSLGHSLHRAQERLARLPTRVQDGAGEVIYQIPRLEFDFKVAMELDEDGDGQQQLRVSTVDGLGQGAEGYVASSVKGSLVAVPIRGGQGRPVLRLEVKRLAEALRVTAVVHSPHGDPLAGARVSFDVDVVDGKLPRGLHFEAAEMVTDDRGRTTNTLVAPASLGARSCRVRVEVLGQVAWLRYDLTGGEG